MNSLHKRKQSQLEQEIVRCGWKSPEISLTTAYLCFVTQKHPKLDLEPARFIWKASEPEIAGEWRACECVFSDFSHLLSDCSMSELSTRRHWWENKKQWWPVRWEGVRVYHELRHNECMKLGEHKKWFNIWNAESEHVYSDINSKKEGKLWRESSFRYLNIFLHCLSRVDTRP